MSFEVTPATVETLKRRLAMEQKKNELLQARLALPVGGGKTKPLSNESSPSGTL